MGEEGPVSNISITKTSRCNDIGNLEEGHFKALGKSWVEIEGIKANQACRKQHDDQVSTKFLVTKEGFDATEHEVVVEVEIYPKNQNSDTN